MKFRSSRNNDTSWLEEGLAVHFSLADLKRQGRLSSDVVYPWKRATDSILKVARKHRQSYIFVWFPYNFAKPYGNNPSTYSNVIQRVLPTRTGYHNIKSEVVVWLSAVNFSTTLKEEDVVMKEWTSDDHWSMYKDSLHEITRNDSPKVPSLQFKTFEDDNTVSEL